MQNILLVTDRGLLSAGIAALLKDSISDISVSVYTPYGNKELFDQNNLADLLVIDLHTSVNVEGLIGLYQSSNKKVIIWVPEGAKEHSLVLFQKGCHGYFYSEMAAHDLIYGTRRVLDGDTYVHPVLSSDLLKAYLDNTCYRPDHPKEPAPKLSKREWEVFRLLVKGLNNKEIAETFSISASTVNNHVHSICRKMKVTSRTNAILTALNQQWFPS